MTICTALAMLASTAFAIEEAKTPISIGEWIEQLGSREYATRQRAEKHLASLGFEAFDALKAAEDHPDVEIAAQARYLSERITISWVQATDHADVQQILQGYGDENSEERAKRVNNLTSFPDAAGVTALCRIVRFEKTQQLSKQAALNFLEAKADRPEFWQRHEQAIQKGLGSSQRPAARWLRAQLSSLTDKPAALAAWTKLIADEQETHVQSPGETLPNFVLSLMRVKVELLKQLERREEAVALMLKMIEMEEGKPETLADLIDWLAKEQAWELVDEVTTRFKTQFDSNAILLYCLAQARSAQGNDKLAEEIAAQALAIGGESPETHYAIARQLQRRGMTNWSEQEYRLVIKLDSISKPHGIMASILLADLLHDQAKELPAAETLQKLSQLLHRDNNVRQVFEALANNHHRTLTTLDAHMEYLFALHEEQQKNFDKQREHLDKAVKHDHSDADVLISMFRLQNASDAYRRKTSAAIKRAAADFQRQIDESPGDAQLYNQWAWLIGNTEGDYDKAVQYSHKSLELRPDTAGYLDTLGRCYYTKGDLANAVKYQQQAANLEPHMMVIGRQLELFKQALAEQEAKP